MDEREAGGLLSFAAAGVGAGLYYLAAREVVDPAGQALLLAFGFLFMAIGLVGVYFTLRTRTDDAEA